MNQRIRTVSGPVRAVVDTTDLTFRPSVLDTTDLAPKAASFDLDSFFKMADTAGEPSFLDSFFKTADRVGTGAITKRQAVAELDRAATVAPISRTRSNFSPPSASAPITNTAPARAAAIDLTPKLPPTRLQPAAGQGKNPNPATMAVAAPTRAPTRTVVTTGPIMPAISDAGLAALRGDEEELLRFRNTGTGISSMLPVSTGKDLIGAPAPPPIMRQLPVEQPADDIDFGFSFGDDPYTNEPGGVSTLGQPGGDTRAARDGGVTGSTGAAPGAEVESNDAGALVIAALAALFFLG